MSLVRDIPLTVSAMAEAGLFTGSNQITTSTAAGSFGSNSTANNLVTSAAETTAFGRVISRAEFPLFQEGFLVAAPAAWIHSTRGDTGACRRLSVGVRLQHGDSSGGGDMADFSTGSTPATANYGTTVRTSEYKSWSTVYSTGELYLPTNPAFYPLRAAKQYVRVAVSVFKYAFTTETTGDEGARVGAIISFMGGHKIPYGMAGYGSTTLLSSSTST